MAIRHLLILDIYVLFAVALTWPLVTHLTSHVPGTEIWAFDEYSFVWSQWWVKYALFDLGVNPLFTRHVFYPIGSNLASFTVLWTHAILGLPVQLALGIIPAANVMVMMTFVLAAFGAYLLARYLLSQFSFPPTVQHLAAFAAGTLFAFSSSRMVYAALGHYTVLSSHWFPFYILFLIKTVREKQWTSPPLAAWFAALALYSDAAHGPLLTLFTLLYLLFERRALVSPAPIARLLLLAVLTALFFVPLLIPLVYELYFSGYQLPGWGHAEKLLVDAMGFWTPTSLHSLNRNWTEELDLVRQGTSRFVDVNTVFVGYVTLALAILAAMVYRSRVGVWIVAAITFALVSLGPLLHINGTSVFDMDGLDVNFPMPFLLLHYVPFLKENRVPNRYSILLMLALAMLAAFAFSWLLTRLAGRRHVTPPGKLVLLSIPYGLLLVALVFEHLSVPLPLTDARVPQVYHQIAQDPGEFAILSLPFGHRNSFTTQGAEDTRTQYYQSVHQKYLLSGNTSRNPPIMFEYFDRLPLFNSLTQVELYNPISPEVLARDKAEAGRLVSFYDIRYVVFNAPAVGRLPYSDTRAATLEYLRKVMSLGERVFDREGVLAYRVNQASLPNRWQIPFGTDASRIHQAEGWDRDEVIADARANWANRTSARVLFPARTLTEYQLMIRALPFEYPGSPRQTLQVHVNGQSLQRFDMSAGWSDYSITIPARVLRSGVNDVVLNFAYAARARDVLPANYSVGNTGTQSAVDIIANAGELGSIKVDGREASKLGRGYNLVVVGARGNVVSARSFNTADEAAASGALAEFVAQIPDGMIVAVASQEEIAGNLSERAVAALRSLGAQTDARKSPAHSHAVIGVKSAAPGSALEQSNAGGSFISIGRVPDERTLAAAISTVTIEAR